MTVFLVPVGQGRFELYSETPEEPAAPPEEGAGRFRRWTHAANAQWHALVDAARNTRHEHAADAPRSGTTGGIRRWLVQWRDRIVCRLAESIAEQRTLWSLRKELTAAVRFPSNIDESQARTVLEQSFAAARRHHGIWLSIDLVLFIASGILFFVPGPNIVAYYLAFRVVGHFNSWRGGRQAQQISWAFEPDGNLAELGSLVDVACDTRAPLVAAIAARLNLPRLGAFFERVAA
jgi:Mitochondrial K+-H+ exchange-related